MLRKILRFGQGRLWSGPWLPALPGSPRPADADDLDALADDDDTPFSVNPAYTEPAEIAALLRELARVPRAQLADGLARTRLASLIRAGAVDGLYTPFGSSEYVLTWAHTPRDVDPRQPVRAWAATATADEDARADREAARYLRGSRGEGR